MKAYFELQYRMTNRWFKDTGFKPWLAYLLLAMGFAGLSVYLFYKTSFAPYIYVFAALSLMGKLSETRRTEFLQLCFGSSKLKQLRITENLLCALPFLAFLLYQQRFIPAGALLALALLLALVRFRTMVNIITWTPFSKKPFEFTCGFRNTFYLFILAYALTGIAAAVNNANLGLFAVLLVFATVLSFYSTPENEYYVWIHNLNPKQFLFDKIKTAWLFSSVLALPAVIVTALFFFDHMGMLLLFVIAGWAFVTALIVAKYAAYPGSITLTQAILLALCLWFPPALLVLIPYLFLKSEKQLSPLLQ